MDRTTGALQGGAALLDAAAVDRLRELDPQGSQGLVPRVMRAYEAALVRHIEELAGARDAVAWDRVSRIAHTLKSSSASVGALGLSRRCGEVESVLRAGPPPQPWPALDELIDEAQQVLAAVRAMLVS